MPIPGKPLSKLAGFIVCLTTLLSVGRAQALETPPSFDLAFYAGQGTQEGNGVVADADGNIYVTGQYTGDWTVAGNPIVGYGGPDYFIASYDSTGAERWGFGAGTTGADYGTSVKLAPNGDVVVSGSIFMPATIHGTNFTGNGGRDAFVARYSSTGAFLWARLVSGVANDEGDDVVVDSEGDVILAGRIRGEVSVGGDTFGNDDTNKMCQFIAKFDSDGNSVWAKAVTTETVGAGTGLALDANNNIYFTGQDVIGSDVFVAVRKYNSSGELIWSTNHLSSSSSSLGTGIAVDSANNVYVAGTYAGSSMTFGTVTLDNANNALRGFLAKYDANGNVLWADRIGGRAYRVDVSPDGEAFTGGFFLAASANFGTNAVTHLGNVDGFVTKHSTSGELAWLHTIATADYAERLRSIHRAASGVVHVSGEGITAAFDLESYPQLGSVVIGRITTNYVPKFTLTRTVSPAFNGSVIPTPQPFNNNRYFSNTVVQVRATPGFGKAFAGWSGALSGMENPTTITMDSDKTVTANFTNAPVRYTLTTSVSPVGGGAVVVSPASENGYDANSVVELSAVPASGKTFAGWSGAVSGTQNPINLTITANASVTATFADAPTPVFTRIVDETTAIPHGTGTFTNLGTPRIIGNSIFFTGSGVGRQGLYKWSNSTVTRLVDTSMTPSGGSGTFSSIGEFNVNEAGDVFFSANATSGTNGIYRIREGVISFLVGNTSAVPNKEQTFRSVRSGYGFGDMVSFNGYSMYDAVQGTGLYVLTNNVITLLIDRNNGTLPGTTSTFVHSDGGVMDDGQLAFWANRSDGKAGIYCYSSNAIHLIADTNTVPPGQTNKFTGFSDPPRINNGKVVFHGSFSGGAGLYSTRADGSSLSKLVDTATSIPGSTNIFQSGFFVAYSGLINGRMLFYQGYWDEVLFRNKARMYLYDNGSIRMIVDGETMLDGETPTNLGWGAQSIQESGDIAFMASFGASAPYTHAIYTTLDADTTPVQYTLTRDVSPNGAGTINANPSSDDGKYDANTMVQLTAVPATGKIFAGWSGAASGTSNPINVTMTENKSITALFTNAPVVTKSFKLSKSVSPAGSGIITANPSSTNWFYPSNTIVTLTATPNSGFKFLRWSGASKSTNTSINLRMNANKTVQALFTNLPRYKLATAVIPPSAGAITLAPFAPTNIYFGGTVVSLTATPNGTNVFSAWIGAAPALEPNASVTMNGSRTVKALFNNPGKLLFQNPGNQVAMWFMQSTNRLASVVLNNGTSAGSNWRLAASADLDQNGAQDLIFRGTNGQVSAWMMDGNTVSEHLLLNEGDVFDPVWRLAAATDFNSDNKADILWQNNAGALNLWLMNGTNVDSGTTLPNTVGGGYRAFAAGHFDTNNSPDIVMQNAQGKVAVWMMNGLTRTSSKMLNGGVSPGTGWIAVGATDINGDRKLDIVFRRSDGGILVWFMNGTKVTRKQILPSTIAKPWVLKAVK